MPVGDGGRAWRILYFDPAVAMRAASDHGQGDGLELTQPVLRDPRAAVLVRRLFLAITLQDSLQHEELLLATFAAVGTEGRRSDDRALLPEVARARSLIDDDPSAMITLADLAEMSGLGRFQLLRAFARALGLTPHAYILQRRVELARRCISAGEGLAEAAIACGFADQSHMTRAFARRYGVTPGSYAAASALQFRSRPA